MALEGSSALEAAGRQACQDIALEDKEEDERGHGGHSGGGEHALFSLEGGQAATTRLLRHGITGVICGSDVLALGAIRAVRRAGLGVPDDVSVVGYDDSAFMNCTDPPLTTVRQPIESMGKAAVALLVNQIENVAVYPEELLFEPELVVRGSTGRPASNHGETQPREA